MDQSKINDLLSNLKPDQVPVNGGAACFGLKVVKNGRTWKAVATATKTVSIILRVGGDVAGKVIPFALLATLAGEQISEFVDNFKDAQELQAELSKELKHNLTLVQRIEETALARSDDARSKDSFIAIANAYLECLCDLKAACDNWRSKGWFKRVIRGGKYKKKFENLEKAILRHMLRVIGACMPLLSGNVEKTEEKIIERIDDKWKVVKEAIELLNGKVEKSEENILERTDDKSKEVKEAIDDVLVKVKEEVKVLQNEFQNELLDLIDNQSEIIDNQSEMIDNQRVMIDKHSETIARLEDVSKAISDANWQTRRIRVRNFTGVDVTVNDVNVPKCQTVNVGDFQWLKRHTLVMTVGNEKVETTVFIFDKGVWLNVTEEEGSYKLAKDGEGDWCTIL